MIPTPAAAPRFEMRGIRKAFGARRARRVDLSVAEGNLRAHRTNGAGKSTLMSILSGALQPDAGQLAIDGHPLCPRATRCAASGIAMITRIVARAALTVMENIIWGPSDAIRPGGWPRMRDMAARALAELGPTYSP